MPGDPAVRDLVRDALAARAAAAARFGFTAPQPAAPEPAPPEPPAPGPSSPRGALIPAGPMGSSPASGDLIRDALRRRRPWR
jgi:hypothetical protein